MIRYLRELGRKPVGQLDPLEALVIGFLFWPVCLVLGGGTAVVLTYLLELVTQ